MENKSLIRPAVSYSNIVSKENYRQKIHKKIQKKIDITNKKLEKIYSLLDDEYAKGKIDRKLYDEYSTRKEDITVDLVALGKIPYASLAKRYITGKINNDEYMVILKAIIPSDYFEEKDKIFQDLENIVRNLKSFKNNCKNSNENECQKCSKKNSIFINLKNINEMILCSKCIYKLETLKRYNGFKGKYFSVKPVKLEFGKNKNKVKMSFNLDLL